MQYVPILIASNIYFNLYFYSSGNNLGHSEIGFILFDVKIIWNWIVSAKGQLQGQLQNSLDIISSTVKWLYLKTCIEKLEQTDWFIYRNIW